MVGTGKLWRTGNYGGQDGGTGNTGRRSGEKTLHRNQSDTQEPGAPDFGGRGCCFTTPESE